MAVVQVVLESGGNVGIVEIKFIFKELRSFSLLKLLFY